MTVDTFLEQFAHLAETPNGVSKLRELILQMAVRGKLVRQDPKDEPVSELLKKVQAERQRLVAEGVIRKTKLLPPIEQREIPFELPEGWQWEQFPSTCYVISPGHRKVKTKDVSPTGTYPVVDQGQSSIAGYVTDASLVIQIPGPVVIFGDHTRAVKYVDFDFVAGADGTKILRPVLLHEWYFYWVLRSLTLDDLGYSRHFKVLKAQLVPIPPLAEQKRIVAKVDELMALCDGLEAKQQAVRTKQIALNHSSLNALTEPNATSLAPAWHRVRDHFDLLYTCPETVAELRQTILQLAVMGRLVPQDPNDEPASELLKKIQAEKHRLIAEGTIRKPKPLPPIEEDEIPFELPGGWQGVKLGQLCSQVSDGPHFSPPYVEQHDGVPFLSSRNVFLDRFELDSVKYVSEEDHAKFCARVKPEKGDILYTKGGTTGVARVNDLDFEFSVWVHIAVLKFPKLHLFPWYLALALNSPHCYEQSQRYTHGTGNRDLGLTRMILITLPLPPLAEQKRIVTKVDQLMTLCDALEAKLHQSQTDADNLLTAIVHELVEVGQGAGTI